MCGKSEHGKTKHTVAWGNVRHSFTDGNDFAGHLITEDASVCGLSRVKRQCLQDIAEIHTRSFHLDQNLATRTRRERERCESEAVQEAAFTGLETQGHCCIEFLLTRRQATRNALHVTSLTAEGDFALVVHVEEFVPEQGKI